MWKRRSDFVFAYFVFSLVGDIFAFRLLHIINNNNNIYYIVNKYTSRRSGVRNARYRVALCAFLRLFFIYLSHHIYDRRYSRLADTSARVVFTVLLLLLSIIGTRG